MVAGAIRWREVAPVASSTKLTFGKHAGVILCFARANGIWTLKTVKPVRRGLSQGVRQAPRKLSRGRHGMAGGCQA